MRQGCILSPWLVNLYAESAMREALDGYNRGFRIGGKVINNLRYADDVVRIATSPENLQKLVDRVRASSEKVGLLINTDKTKVMACGNNGKSTRINLSGEVLEEVESFVYLGVIFTSDSNTVHKTLKKRLAMGKSAMQSLTSVWKSKYISTTTKVKLLKALVWSIAIYGRKG